MFEFRRMYGQYAELHAPSPLRGSICSWLQIWHHQIVARLQISYNNGSSCRTHKYGTACDYSMHSDRALALGPIYGLAYGTAVMQ